MQSRKRQTVKLPQIWSRRICLENCKKGAACKLLQVGSPVRRVVLSQDLCLPLSLIKSDFKQ